MDWYDVGPDTWLETVFGDVNVDGYFDIADDPTSDPAAYVTALFPDFGTSAAVEPDPAVDAQPWSAVPDAAGAFEADSDADVWAGPVDDHLSAPPW